MKRNLLTALILTGALTAAQAADYQYLAIEKSDGTTQTLTAVGLTLTYSNGQMTAANGTEQASIPLTELRRMYFTNSQSTTAIDTIEATADDWNDTTVEIYDLSGRQLPQGTKPARGLYIFKKGNTTTKKYVK